MLNRTHLYLVVPDPHYPPHDFLDHSALGGRVVEVGEGGDVANGQFGRSVDALCLHGRQGQFQAAFSRGLVVPLDGKLFALSCYSVMV